MSGSIIFSNARGIELESNPGPLASQATALTCMPYRLGIKWNEN